MVVDPTVAATRQFRARAGRRALSYILVGVAAATMLSIPSADAASGDVDWVTRYEPGWRATAVGPAVSPDGTLVYVAGRIFDDVAVFAYDTVTGSVVWQRRLKVQGSDVPTDLHVFPDGSALLVTTTSSGGPTDAYLTVAYDASTGRVLWERRFDRPLTDDRPRAAAVDVGSDTVFVTGASTFPDFSRRFRFVTVAYDADTGEQLWSARRGGGRDVPFGSFGIVAHPEQDAVFISSSAFRPDTGDDFLTFALQASTGASLWARYDTTKGEFGDYVGDIGIAPDGSTVYVTGNSFVEPSVIRTVARDTTTGRIAWVGRQVASHVYGGSPSNTVDSHGNVWVVGEFAANIGTLGYTASGEALWSVRSGNAGGGYGIDVATSPDGGVVYSVGTARQAGSVDYDFITFAYAAEDGRTLWKHRYDGHDQPPRLSFLANRDTPSGVAVSPGGEAVFVTGRSAGVDTGRDIATLRYDA